jgi:5-bromo-4-chloroindolyl phosphate hydrolysis protein
MCQKKKEAARKRASYSKSDDRTSSSSRTPYKLLSEDELRDRLTNMRRQLNQAHKKIDRLSAKFMKNAKLIDAAQSGHMSQVFVFVRIYSHYF